MGRSEHKRAKRREVLRGFAPPHLSTRHHISRGTSERKDERYSEASRHHTSALATTFRARQVSFAEPRTPRCAKRPFHDLCPRFGEGWRQHASNHMFLARLKIRRGKREAWPAATFRELAPCRTVRRRSYLSEGVRPSQPEVRI